MRRGVMAMLVAVVALAGCERAPRRRMAKAVTGDARFEPLPRHAVVSSINGLGAYGPVESRVVLDLDTGVLTRIASDGATRTLVLPPDEVHRLDALTEAAWVASPPPSADVSDYTEIVLAVDGPDRMRIEVSGPLRASPARTLVGVLRAAAGWGY